MADLWVRGCGREQYVNIEGGIDLSSERPDPVPTFADVARVSSDWLLRYQVWIDNWLQINPYLVANARTSTSIACRSSSSSMSSVAPSWVGPLVLSAEYDRHDVMRTIQQGLTLQPLAHHAALRETSPGNHAASSPTQASLHRR